MKILIIDDDKQIASFLKSALEAECFEVDVSNDGEDGSFLARTNEYDVIILDYNLPKKDGEEVCKEVRSDNISTPIIMLSVQSDTKTKTDLINTGADDYIAKPFSLDELLARIHAILRRPKILQSDIITLDDLEINTKSHIVKRGEKEISLTLKEFMILEFLMRNQGNVVTRAAILEHAWDMNADLFSNTIEAHISNLRRKIDISGKTRLINTISGRGYKISLP